MADITWELLVDWAKDSNPTDEAGKMVSFLVRRGRTSDVWGANAYTYVNPGEFDVELDNYDRRYDAFYNPAAVITDNFKESDYDTLLEEHIPDTVPIGSAWAKAGVTDDIAVVSYRASVAGGNDATYVIDSGLSDIYLTITVNLGEAVESSKIIFRYTDTDNYLYLNIDYINDEIKLISRTSGAETTLATKTATLAHSTDYAVTLYCESGIVNATVGGYAIGASGAAHTTATMIGIGAVALGATAATFDTLSVRPSSLYNYLKPHVLTRLRGTYNGVLYYLISGWERNITPMQSSQTIQRARFVGKDGIDWLAKQEAPHLALQTNYYVSDAILDMITEIDWPFSGTSGWIVGTSQLGIDTYLGSANIDNNGDALPYWWSDPEQSVMGEIRALSGAYNGNAFVAADGVFSYRPRLYSTPPVVTITGDIIGDKYQLPQPWDELYNSIRITAQPRQATASNTELWRLNYEPAIAAGETLTIWAKFNYLGKQCPASSVTTPASTTDYTAGSASGLTDKTAQVSIVITTYATEAKLDITNNDAAAVYLSLMKLRGTGIYNYSKVTATAEDTTSSNPTTGYGKSTFSLDSEWMQTTDDAASHAAYAKIVYANPRKVLFVIIEDMPDYQMAADLFDKVAVSIDDLDIDGNYILTYIEHQWSAEDCILRTKWRLTPSAEEIGVFWIVGESALGTETTLGW